MSVADADHASPPRFRTVRTMCPMNCHPTHCGLRITLEGERVVEAAGDPEHPESRGFACIRGQATVDIVDNPARVLVPRERGAGGTFVDVTWEAALDRIASTIAEVGPVRSALYTGHGVRNQFSARFAHQRLAWGEPAHQQRPANPARRRRGVSNGRRGLLRGASRGVAGLAGGVAPPLEPLSSPRLAQIAAEGCLV